MAICYWLSQKVLREHVALLVALAVMDRYMWGVGAVGVPRPSPALPWGCLPKQPGGQSDAKALHTCQQSNALLALFGLTSTSNFFLVLFSSYFLTAPPSIPTSLIYWPRESNASTSPSTGLSVTLTKPYHYLLSLSLSSSISPSVLHLAPQLHVWSFPR